MTSLQAFEILLQAAKDMADVMIAQARIIEEQKAVDASLQTELKAKREKILKDIKNAEVRI